MAEEPNISVIATEISYIKRDVAKINDKLDNSFVTREEFTPIRNLVYGTVGLILISFMGVLTALVFQKHV